MHEPKHDPWPFVVLAVLIVLGIAATLYLAARLMVAPQLGETVTVTPTPQPSASAQKEEEEELLFFPWNSYTPDMVQGSLRPDHEAEYRAWHKENLVAVPEILGFSGMEAWADQEQAGYHLGFWTDCPVTAKNGQPALLDVAFGRDDVNFGMTWVARSTGDLPTQAQQEAAVAQVTQDIQQEFLGTGGAEEPALGTMLQDVLVCLLNSPQADDVTSFPWFAQKYLVDMTLLFRDLYRTMVGQPFRVIVDPLEDIRTEAENLGLTIQMYTGQRQVVVIYTYDAPDSKDETTLAVYYDMVLEQYSGLVINAVEDNGK